MWKNPFIIQCNKGLRKLFPVQRITLKFQKVHLIQLVGSTWTTESLIAALNYYCSLNKDSNFFKYIFKNVLYWVLWKYELNDSVQFNLSLFTFKNKIFKSAKLYLIKILNTKLFLLLSKVLQNFSLCI